MKRNYSYTYILPLIAEKVYFDKKILACIKDTYIFNKNSSYNKDCFIIKANFKNTMEYMKLEQRMMDNSLFIDSYSLPNGDSIYIYSFPKNDLEDRDCFIKGLYSKMSVSSKRKILSFWTTLYGNNPSFVTTVLMKIKHILFKDEKLRHRMIEELKSEIDKGAELGYLIDEDKETFDFNTTNKLVKNNIL